jgi:hypothetical protein
MRDPDWVQTEGRRGISLPALIGLVAVAAVAVVCLVVVTLIVLHRPIGTSNNDGVTSQSAPAFRASAAS